MINTDGTVVDLYIPRKWYANALIVYTIVDSG